MTRESVTIREPSEEVVRIAAGLVRLTWLQSIEYANDDEAVAHLVIRPSQDWANAPDGAKAWLEGITG